MKWRMKDNNLIEALITTVEWQRLYFTETTTANGYQVEGRSWIYVQHVNLAFLGGRPVNLRATRKFTGQ